MKERKVSRLPRPIGPPVSPSSPLTISVPSREPIALKMYRHPSTSSDGFLPSIGRVAPPRTRYDARNIDLLTAASPSNLSRSDVSSPAPTSILIKTFTAAAAPFDCSTLTSTSSTPKHQYPALTQVFDKVRSVASL